MSRAIFRIACVAIVLVLVSTAATAQVLLYANDFENPKSPPEANCGPDLDVTPVNTLWGGTGQGTGGGGNFLQQYTIETLLIKGPGKLYADPSGKGGNFCLGMLSTLEDDKLALVLNTQNLKYVNLSFDLSGIDIGSCGGPVGVDVPKMNVKLYKLGDGEFDFFNPGNVLAEADLTGSAAEQYTFNWTRVQASLEAGEENSAIVIVFDLTQSSYAAFDNIRIEANDRPLPVVLSGFSGSCRKSNAELRWTTSSEINNAWYDVESSANGSGFIRVGRVKSLNSLNGGKYSFEVPGGCQQDRYYRIAMVDRDGTVKHSAALYLKGVATVSIPVLKVLPNGVMLAGGQQPRTVRLMQTSGGVLATRLLRPDEIWRLAGLPAGIYLAVADGAEPVRVMITR